MEDYGIHFVAEANPAEGYISFESGKDPEKSWGIAKLVQILAKLFLTNTEEDLVDPHIGGNVRKLANTYPRFLRSDAGITELAIICMNRVIDIVKATQVDVADPDERLDTLELRKAWIDWDDYKGIMEFDVTAESGEQAVLRLLAGR